MSAQIIDGKATAESIRKTVAERVQKRLDKGLRAPGLAVILVGKDPASEVYVKHKRKDCEEVGINSQAYDLPSSASQGELLSLIDELNNDDTIDGILVQLPLPAQLKSDEILERISPDKDVDGFHPTNVGKMALNLPTFISATPFGILELLDRYEVETSGKHVVVLGRSHIVGSPMSILLSQKRKVGNATVTLSLIHI